jgi:hypothetical protein
MAGATLVAVNTWFRTRELAHVLRHCDCTTLVTADRYLGQDYLGLLPEVGIDGGRLPLLRTIVCLPSHGVATPPGMMPLCELAAFGRDVPDATLDTVATGLRPDDIAYILYTSGTTAMPKGAQLCHAGIIENGFHIGERQHLRETDRLRELLIERFGANPPSENSAEKRRSLGEVGAGSELLPDTGMRACESAQDYAAIPLLNPSPAMRRGRGGQPTGLVDEGGGGFDASYSYRRSPMTRQELDIVLARLGLAVPERERDEILAAAHFIAEISERLRPPDGRDMAAEPAHVVRFPEG